MSIQKILAIDYGRVRIGLAISYGTFAEPFKIIPNSDTTWAELLDILHQENITQIVVGLSAREMAAETKEFAGKLAEKTDIPIDFFDESFSSKKVQQKLIEAGTKQSKRRQPIDHFAAAEFLQEYLDSLGDDGMTG